LSTGIDWQLKSINHLTNRRPPNATANDEPARTRDDTTVATFETSERHSFLPSMPQDMPPRGGYEPVQYKRNLPAKGFRPGILLLGMGAVMGYGWYKLIGGMREAKYVISPSTRTCIHLQQNTPATYKYPTTTIAHTKNNDLSNPILTTISELGREKMWARINLIPLLQAEEDRDQVRRYLADQKREKELLGDNAKVYNSDRFVRPTFAVTPPPTTN
ncbi:hypothetical protein LB503_002211, partial [Fusarium chuoi]